MPEGSGVMQSRPAGKMYEYDVPSLPAGARQPAVDIPAHVTESKSTASASSSPSSSLIDSSCSFLCVVCLSCKRREELLAGIETGLLIDDIALSVAARVVTGTEAIVLEVVGPTRRIEWDAESAGELQSLWLLQSMLTWSPISQIEWCASLW